MKRLGREVCAAGLCCAQEARVDEPPVAQTGALLLLSSAFLPCCGGVRAAAGRVWGGGGLSRDRWR